MHPVPEALTGPRGGRCGGARAAGRRRRGRNHAPREAAGRDGTRRAHEPATPPGLTEQRLPGGASGSGSGSWAAAQAARPGQRTRAAVTPLAQQGRRSPAEDSRPSGSQNSGTQTAHGAQAQPRWPPPLASGLPRAQTGGKRTERRRFRGRGLPRAGQAETRGEGRGRSPPPAPRYAAGPAGLGLGPPAAAGHGGRSSTTPRARRPRRPQAARATRAPPQCRRRPDARVGQLSLRPSPGARKPPGPESAPDAPTHPPRGPPAAPNARQSRKRAFDARSRCVSQTSGLSGRRGGSVVSVVPSLAASVREKGRGQSAGERTGPWAGPREGRGQSGETGIASVSPPPEAKDPRSSGRNPPGRSRWKAWGSPRPGPAYVGSPHRVCARAFLRKLPLGTFRAAETPRPGAQRARGSGQRGRRAEKPSGHGRCVLGGWGSWSSRRPPLGQGGGRAGHLQPS